MTNPVSIISTDLVLLDVDAGADKESVIDRLAGLLADGGRVNDREALKAAALAREAQSATGLPGGIAIPHCRSGAVGSPSIGFARLSPKVDFGAPDGPADLVFLIAAPDGAGAEHMKLLSSLARALVRPDFVASLRAAGSADEVVALVDGVVNPDGAAAPAATPAPKPAAAQAKSIVAITACPTGIAHTYLAADGWSTRTAPPLPQPHPPRNRLRHRRSRSSRSRRARPVSPTPTWLPTRSSWPPNGPE